jgi:hypothetical protein
MTAEGEIRMQAFMVGNGNYSIPSFVILTFGAILLPELGLTFYVDFKKGRSSVRISEWSIEKHAHRNLADLRAELILSDIEKTKLKVVAFFRPLTSIK